MVSDASLQGSARDGECPVCRWTVPPHGIPGLHASDPRRGSAADPTLRGGVPGPYGGMAPRSAGFPDRAPIEWVPALPLSTPDDRLLFLHVPNDIQPPRDAGPPLRHGPAHSASVDPRPRTRTAGSISVKRCRLLPDRIRLWKEGLRALLMVRCCALHNVRVRLTPWQPMIA